MWSRRAVRTGIERRLRPLVPRGVPLGTVLTVDYPAAVNPRCARAGVGIVIVGRRGRRQKACMKNWATVMLLLFAVQAGRLIAAEAGWQSLFNGRDLAGWQANADAGAFTIVDGAIRAHATHPTNRGHLFFTGDRKTGEENFRNFELVAVVRGEPNSNSGIFFHTDRTTRDGVLHLRNGYEVQLNSSKREKRKTGSLYSVVDVATSPVDESQWFTVRVRVEGKRIQVWINDRRTVDYTEPENPVRTPERAGRLLRSEGGAIALQAHDDNSTFYFREIRVRRLP